MKTKRKLKVGIQRKLLKLNLDKDNIFFILTLIVGVGAAFIAVSYAKIINFLNHYLYPDHDISNEAIAIGALMVFISGYPVMKFGYICGVVSTNDLCQAYAKFQGECLLDQILTKQLVTIHPDQSLLYAFHLLKKNKVSRILVTSKENDRTPVGIITAEDIVNCFGFHIQDESKSELIDRFMEEESISIS